MSKREYKISSADNIAEKVEQIAIELIVAPRICIYIVPLDMMTITITIFFIIVLQ